MKRNQILCFAMSVMAISAGLNCVFADTPPLANVRDYPVTSQDQYEEVHEPILNPTDHSYEESVMSEPGMEAWNMINGVADEEKRKILCNYFATPVFVFCEESCRDPRAEEYGDSTVISQTKYLISLPVSELEDAIHELIETNYQHFKLMPGMKVEKVPGLDDFQWVRSDSPVC